jgi:UDP-2-acetamido-3-amino-2,3-dideoxy-glucuronate N-acetyltransferase
MAHNLEISDCKNVGAGTRIGALACIRSGASIGRDCVIGDSVFIDHEVDIGSGVTIGPEAQLQNGLILENDVIVGANAKLAVDLGSRSGESVKTIVKRAASIGAGATIASGVLVGAGAVVGARSTVVASVPPGAVVAGDPAGVLGYRDTERLPVSASRADSSLQTGGSKSLRVHGCCLQRVASTTDPRGRLTVADLGEDLPFATKRVFIVHNVPDGQVRGGHSHRNCSQFLLAAQGSISAIIDDGRARDEILLDDPGVGLFLPPGIWSIQYRFTNCAVLVVFASRPYEPADYIRDYDEFRSTKSPIGE